MSDRNPRRVPTKRRVGRGAALLAAGALAVGLVPSLGSGSAAAGSPDAGAAALLAAAPQTPPPGRAWVQGVVVNQADRPVDGILVEAYRSDEPDKDSDADPVASWITYAGPEATGAPDHGFFRLYLPRGQDAIYDLRFSSPEDTADPYETRGLDNSLMVQGTPTSPGTVIDLDEDVVMSLVRQAEASVDTRVDTKTVEKRRAATMQVQVTSPDVAPVTGTVQMLIDHKRSAVGVLKTKDDGSTRFTVPALKPGKHTIATRYLGSEDVKPSAAKATKVTIEQPKKNKPKKTKKGEPKKDKPKKDKKGKGKRG